MEIQLAVEGMDPVEGLEELSEWLGQEPKLRGLLAPQEVTRTCGSC